MVVEISPGDLRGWTGLYMLKRADNRESEGTLDIIGVTIQQVPCHFPRLDEATLGLTSWMRLSVPLPQFCPGCTGQEYESISYVKVYATCCLRRIRFESRIGLELNRKCWAGRMGVGVYG